MFRRWAYLGLFCSVSCSAGSTGQYGNSTGSDGSSTSGTANVSSDGNSNATGDGGSSNGTGNVGSSSSPTVQTKSAKRGIAYDLTNQGDIGVLSPGVSWWYNWGSSPNSGVPSNYLTADQMVYEPMLWNGNFNKTTIEAFLAAHPEIKYLLVLNEPNVSGQATCAGKGYCEPADAAALWPQYEAIAQDMNVQIVGPQITWGTDPNYGDPNIWLSAFYSAYEAANNGRQPRIDYLGFHWYDYGLTAQLNALLPYHKPFWVTEFANTHNGDGSAQIDTAAKQETQMNDMVSALEARGDVLRYSWFTGRWAGDTHYASLLGAQGALTDVGQYYISLPYTAAPTPVLVAAGSSTAKGSYVADTEYTGGTTTSTTQSVGVDASVDTATQAVYQTSRTGNFTYTLKNFTPLSFHIVKLHFAETKWTATNQRVFNVSLNSNAILTNYDIFRAAGAANKARVETFSAQADSSGNISIGFSTVTDSPMVNGIEVN